MKESALSIVGTFVTLQCYQQVYRMVRSYKQFIKPLLHFLPPGPCLPFPPALGPTYSPSHWLSVPEERLF